MTKGVKKMDKDKENTKEITTQDEEELDEEGVELEKDAEPEDGEVTEASEDAENQDDSEAKKEIDPHDSCIVYDNHYYPVRGLIQNFALTKEKDAKDEIGNPILTVNDLVPGTGYIDDTSGKIYIYYDKPNKDLLIPWFTCKETEDKGLKFAFSSRSSESTRKAFTINELYNQNQDYLLRSVESNKPVYDDKMQEELMKNRSTYTTVIKDSDDFLKKVIKKCLMESGVNPRSFDKYAEKSWTIPNIIQVLGNDTKLSTKFFLELMGYGGWEFRVIARNGRNCKDPIPGNIVYDSTLNDVYVEGKEDENESNSRIVTTRQFHNDDD